MTQSADQTCPGCYQAIPATARFCPYCGAPMARFADADELVIGTGKRLRVSQDLLHVRSLWTMVDASLTWWQQHSLTVEGINRERAASAIKDLSRVLDSLAQQLAQGRETIRITTRLPSTRQYSVGCPICGRGNRVTARFCKSCGSPLPQEGAEALPSRAAYPMLRLQRAAQSDTGRVRAQNEDVCYAGALQGAGGLALTLLLVADGMGGAQAGEEASRLASETAHQTLQAKVARYVPSEAEEWHQLLRSAVQAANEQVYTMAQSSSSRTGMGTTLTLLVVAGMQAHMAHVGDSRAYLCNASGVTEDGATALQLTSDHTLVARLVEIGQLSPEKARTHPQRNVIHRALGMQPSVDVDTSSQPLQVGDALLLCSDGLTTHLEDSELARTVLAASGPDEACTRLIARANQQGGIDNISVVVAMVSGIDHVHLPAVR